MLPRNREKGGVRTDPWRLILAVIPCSQEQVFTWAGSGALMYMSSVSSSFVVSDAGNAFGLPNVSLGSIHSSGGDHVGRAAAPAGDGLNAS